MLRLRAFQNLISSLAEPLRLVGERWGWIVDLIAYGQIVIATSLLENRRVLESLERERPFAGSLPRRGRLRFCEPGECTLGH
jgi:hypothetical protein